METVTVILAVFVGTFFGALSAHEKAKLAEAEEMKAQQEVQVEVQQTPTDHIIIKENHNGLN